MHSSTLITLALAAAASARPTRFGRRQSFNLANGQAAIAQNAQFATLTADSPCTEGQDACVNQGFAQCVSGKFVVQPCAATTICAALPLTNAAGTSIACTTQADLDARLAATGATTASSAAVPPPASTSAAAATGDNSAAGGAATNATTTAAGAAGAGVNATTTAASTAAGTSAIGSTNTADPASAPPPSDPQALQSSTTVDPSVIQNTGTGQDPPVAGQADAAVSTNNFANFCALGLPQVPITNGLQLTTGSCNPIPIGNIPSTANIPSQKFQSPTNGDTLTANTPFNVTLQVQKVQLGTFTNAAQTYFANPQTLNAQGEIIGHTHIVIEDVGSLASTALTDANSFAFFKGVDGGQDANNQVVVPVAAGLPAGVYRMGTILSSATHQPAIVAIAQHGLVDDVVYFTVQ